MHRLEGERLGLAYDYALIDFDEHGLAHADLGAVVAAAEDEGFAGLNITHPFKQGITELLTDLAPDAAAIGAVNTVVFAEGARIGHNTDGWGFATSFRREMAGCALDTVALFGAGGGGAAVANALLDLGATTLHIVDPDRGRSTSLVERLRRDHGPHAAVVSTADEAVALADGVVNATPIGMAKYPGTPFGAARLRPDQWVADIVYFPEDTELLRIARGIGCRTQTGRGMAVFQAAKAFELFTGIAPDPAAMSRHFDAATTEAAPS